jgi:hypothetical protein
MAVADVIVVTDPLWQQLLVSFAGTAGALLVAWLVYKWTRRDERTRLAAEMSNSRQMAFEQRKQVEFDAQESGARTSRARQAAGLAELSSDIGVHAVHVTWSLLHSEKREDGEFRDSVLRAQLKMHEDLLRHSRRINESDVLIDRVRATEELARKYVMALSSTQATETEIEEAQTLVIRRCRLLSKSIMAWEDSGVLDAWPGWDNEESPSQSLTTLEDKKSPEPTT